MSKNTHNRPLTRSSVHTAHQRIKTYIHETPVLTSHAISDIASTPQTVEAISKAAEDKARDAGTSNGGSDVRGDAQVAGANESNTNGHGPRPARPRMNLWFKCENMQRVGAFKARGAFHALGRLTDGELEGGVITHSSGNHAAALALAARSRGVPAQIIMPTISTPSKIAATRSYSAHIHFSGSTAPEREAVVAEIQKETGAVLIPPYDHVDVIIGQGTAALEFEAQVKAMITDGIGYPESYGTAPGAGANGDGGAIAASEGLDCVIVPCGGGGLLAGTATALAGTGTTVFGAEPTKDGADDCRRGLAATPPTRIPHVNSLTIADGVRTPVGPIPWSVISDRSKVQAVYSVSEAQIVEAMRLIFERLKVVVEPSAAVAVAVVLFDEGFRGWVERMGDGGRVNVGIVLSGGNTTMDVLAGLFARGEMEGRAKESMEREVGVRGMDGEEVAEDVAG